MRASTVFVLSVVWGAFGCSAGGGSAGVIGSGGSHDLPASLDATAGPASPLTIPSRRLRRLSNREYDNVVFDLLGDSSMPATAFIADSYTNGYDNGSAGLAVQSDQAVGYEEAAEALAARAVSGNMSRLVGPCDPATQGNDACFQAFLASFAPRAYRRPLTASEEQRLDDVFQFASQEGFAVGIQTALEVVLQSPEFLYREELGPVGSVASGTIALTDYEVASELSFLLTGSMPDDQLWAAASQGAFHSADDYQREATRLLGSPGAKAALRAFLHEWMATDRLGTLTKLPTIYPAFNFAMAASMSGELDRFYDDVLWAQAGSLRDLFTSTRSFADPTLAALYGVTTTDAGFAPVVLDSSLRAGIMSRLGYLAVHSDTDSSGPIARGVFLMQSILCSPLSPPPPNVPPAPTLDDPRVANATTRQRFALHAASAACAACHTVIDGFGFGFEEFDGLGIYRTTEKGQPVDSSGTILGTGDIDGPFNGVADLAAKLVRSDRPLECFTKQAYRYAMGQVEPPGDDLGSLRAGFAVDAPMTDVLKTIVNDPIFVTRAFEPTIP
jgi:uncharacterized protein DUF1592/uncharacterized protein DUF1588/uncharacterized protein DUF1595/uncharacterized protein DUF1587